MSIQHPYRQLDEVTSEIEQLQASTISDIYYSRVQPDSESNFIFPGTSLATLRWPKIVGIVQIINGFITGFLGVMEVFIVPMLEDTSDEHAIIIGKRNCFAAGIFAGLMMMITGSTAVRASISQRGSTITRYMILTLLSVLLYTGFSILLILGFTQGWTEKDKYRAGSSLYEVHIFLTASTLLGLLFVITAFIQYYEVVFFGDIQLCRKCLSCCCYTFCRVKRYEEEQRDGNTLV